MKKLIVTLFLVSLLIVANAQNFNSSLAAKLQAKLDEMMSMSPNTKGMSAGVYVPGQGIWTGVSGLSYAGQAITPDMEFGLASNSKLFTAVVMLILAEKNILSLEDHLYMWLPNFKNINSNATIRQLLNHTSGIDDMFTTQAQIDSINKNPLRAWTPEEVLGWIGPMKFTPGTNYWYSNTNYILAGMIAKKATGKHISTLIREYILDPFQLKNTFYDVEETILGPIAHRWYNNVDYHDTSRISLNTAGGPAGSMFSTPADMVNWYNKLLSGQILNANSLAQMTNFLAPGSYGLGIGTIKLFNKTLWGHGGRTLGYRNRMFYDPCMKVIICGLSNSDPSAVDGNTALLYKVLSDYLPACAGPISGTATVCPGQNSVSYTVPAILNATKYVWTLPNGFIGTSTSNTITINFDQTATSGNIMVTGENSYGQGASSSFYVSVHPSIVAVITPMGSTSICPGSTLNLTSNDASTYLWSTGATTKSITVSNAGTYSLTVTNAYGCKSLPTSIQIKSISKPAQPNVILGNSFEVCANTTQSYSVTWVNDVQYYWIAPLGATISQGQGTPNVMVSFSGSFTNGKLGVIMYNSCGNSPIRYLDIFSVPETPGYINGTMYSNCQTHSNFTIKKVNNAKSYTWTTDIPGAVITPISNSSDTAVNIKFPMFTTGTIQVTANNNCGSSITRETTVYGVPVYPDKIYGNLTPCTGSIQYYYIAGIPGATKYNWTVPPGTVYLTGSTTNIIKVQIGSTAGDISVNAENACGVGGKKKITISIPCQIQAIKNNDDFEMAAFPNPTNGTLYIEMKESVFGNGTIQIIDIQGKSIWTKDIDYVKGRNSFTLNLDEFKSGLYSVVFSTANKIKTSRIIKTD
jgi:CubicO group peptidase (beta-lactamase class C family)